MKILRIVNYKNSVINADNIEYKTEKQLFFVDDLRTNDQLAKDVVTELKSRHSSKSEIEIITYEVNNPHTENYKFVSELKEEYKTKIINEINYYTRKLDETMDDYYKKFYKSRIDNYTLILEGKYKENDYDFNKLLIINGLC